MKLLFWTFTFTKYHNDGKDILAHTISNRQAPYEQYLNIKVREQ
jgi:hypothetical protein